MERITDNIQTALAAGAASVQPVTSHDGIAYVAVPEGYKNMTQKFRFCGKAEILHLNARKEGPDGDKQLAVDVKLRAVTTMAVLYYFDDMLGQLFYTDIGAVRNTMIGPIPMKHELEDYRLEVMGGTHYGVKLKKFALEAMDDGMVSITFQASFKPSGDEVAQMAEYLQDEIDIYLEPANAELDLGDSAANKPALSSRQDDFEDDIPF